MFKNMRKSVGLTSALSILLGIILLIFPGTASTVLCFCLGAVILINGIISIVRYFSVKSFFARSDLFFGLVLCGIGLFMLLNSRAVISAVPYVVGLFITLDGFLNLQNAVDLKRMEYSNWWVILLLALLTAALGILMLCNPFEAAVTTVMIIGASLIYDGIVNLWAVHCFGKVKKSIKYMIEDLSEGDFKEI